MQGNDKRLTDARSPLPHTHDYAPSVHSFNGHSGALSVKETRNAPFNEITPPSDESAVIYGKNESAEDGAIGIAGVVRNSAQKTPASYGVVGHSSHIGVRGQSSGGDSVKGCGVMGLSRFGAGGVFVSEHDYALVADGFGQTATYDETVTLRGDGKALLVNGISEFRGPLHVNGKEGGDYPFNIVEFFEVDEDEYVSAGDLLVVSESGKGILSRSRREYARSVVGIVSGNPVLIINNTGQEKKIYPVCLAGRALCRVDARTTPVKPGDLIVASSTPACGMAGTINSFERVGTVVAKALDGLEEGIGVIPVFITHC